MQLSVSSGHQEGGMEQILLQSFQKKHLCQNLDFGLLASRTGRQQIFGASQVAQWSRICLPVQDPQVLWVRSLSLEDPSEEEMATHSSVVAWRTPWTEEPGGPQSVGFQRVGYK